MLPSPVMVPVSMTSLASRAWAGPVMAPAVIEPVPEPSTLPLPVDRLDEYDAGGLVMVIVLVWAIMLTWTLFTLTGLHGELRRAMPEDDIKEDGE